MNTIFLGTYEGRLLGYTVSRENDKWKLNLEYAVETHIGSVKSLASHYVGKIPYVLSGGVDESIRIFNMNEAKESGTILFHQGDITTLTFAGNQFFLSGGADGAIAIWKTSDWTKQKVLGRHKYFKSSRITIRGGVLHICVHPSNRVALSIGNDNSMRMWNLVQGKPSFSRKYRERPLKVLFSPDSKRYAVLFSSKATVFDLADGQEVFSTNVSLGLSDMLFMENGEFVVVGNDKCIHLYDMEGKEVRCIKGNTELRLRTVEMVKIPAGEKMNALVVTGSSDGTIQLWDVDAEENNLLASVKTSERITCCTSLMKM